MAAKPLSQKVWFMGQWKITLSKDSSFATPFRWRQISSCYKLFFFFFLLTKTLIRMQPKQTAFHRPHFFLRILWESIWNINNFKSKHTFGAFLSLRSNLVWELYTHNLLLESTAIRLLFPLPPPPGDGNVTLHLI